MMNWLSTALLSALFLSFYDICKKHALQNNPVWQLLFISNLFGALFFIPLLFTSQTVPLTTIEHMRIAFKALLVGASWVFNFYAMKNLPISIASPLRASAPVYTLLGAMIFLGERPHSAQIIGVFFMVGSFLLLARLGKKEGIHFRRNRWLYCMMGSILLGAASSLYDKILLGHESKFAIPAFSLQAWFYCYLLAFLAVPSAIERLRTRTCIQWRFSIPLIGLFLAASDCIYFFTVSQPGAMISLVSPIRRSSAVVSFLLGGHFFKEKNLWHKSAALALVIVGIVLISR